MPNLVSVIHERNKLALSSFRAAQPHPRTIVDVKSIMLYNPCSDFRLNFRHSVPALCGPSAVPSFLNDSACLTLASKVPACLDAYDLMTEDCPIQADKADAMEDVCRDVAEIAFHGEKLAYDARKPAVSRTMRSDDLATDSVKSFCREIPTFLWEARCCSG